VYVKHLSSLQFLTYCAFFGVVVAALFRFVPGRKPPVRTEPYSEQELTAHDRKLAKYFVAGGFFLVLGSVHMAVKNIPPIAEYLARTGYAGHLVRDLSNTHVMIVGGGTLLATGLCWLVLPRIVRRPLASEGLAQCAFWFTAIGLSLFYVSLIGNGIAIGRLIEHGWAYPLAKEHMGKWYKVPTGMGAGIMGLGYWCFAANVCLTIFQSRLVKVAKPQWHLWKFFATGAAALTVGTVQGVIQVQPANADWLYKAKHAGEWIDPISHAHINLVTGLTMLVAGALYALLPEIGGVVPSRRVANASFFALLGGSLAFYGSTLYLGLHEGGLVVHRGLTPEQAEEATRIHPYLIMGAGIAMFAAFWFLLSVIVRAVHRASAPARAFVLVGCGALAIGTLQGPVQAFPAVNDVLDRGGDAGDVVVNLHAQLNMLAGLMVILMGLALATLWKLGADWRVRSSYRALTAVAAGVGVYYAAGVAFSAIEAHRIAQGQSFVRALRAFEPWEALVLVPAALAALGGYASYARAAWRMSALQRAENRRALAAAPGIYTGKIPKRVRRRSPAALAAYELPMGLMGFPGLGWLFAGFPFTASILLTAGPAFAWAVIPAAFTPFGQGPLREIGWKIELVWLPLSALVSSAALYRAHARRRARLFGNPPRTGRRLRVRLLRSGSYRTRVGVAVGAIVLLLISLPFVPAVAGIGTSSVRYAYQPRFTRDVTGQFLRTPRGPVKLFSWSDPQASYPADALRVHAADVRALLVRAAAVDEAKSYQLYDLARGTPVPLVVNRRTSTTLALVPAGNLHPGRYAFVATHEGMFGGRDFDYVTVVSHREAATAIDSNPHGTTRPVFDALLPLATSLVALAFALRLLGSWFRRRAAQKLFWGFGFLLFAVAASAETAAYRHGWTPGLFRLYYVSGGVLTVASLGAGSAWLLLPRRLRDAMVGALFVAGLSAVVAVLLAPVHVASLAHVTSARPPSNHALGGHAFVWAIALNSFGTVFLIGGSAWSVLRRRRVRTNVWIGLGALVVALATGMSRAGSYSYVYGGELVGISLMFCGFTLSPGKRAERREPAAAPAAAVVTR
jgi:hypothetical protein